MAAASSAANDVCASPCLIRQAVRLFASGNAQEPGVTWEQQLAGAQNPPETDKVQGGDGGNDGFICLEARLPPALSMISLQGILAPSPADCIQARAGMTGEAAVGESRAARCLPRLRWLARVWDRPGFDNVIVVFVAMWVYIANRIGSNLTADGQVMSWFNINLSTTSQT